MSALQAEVAPLWMTLSDEERLAAMAYMTESEKEQVLAYMRAVGGMAASPMQWVQENHPEVVKSPFAQHHIDWWKWIDDLLPGVKPKPTVQVWARGGAKSSSLELACDYLEAKGTRKFILIVSGTQEQANSHVQAIATLLERRGVQRAVNAYGTSKAWRQEMLQTASGFTIAAFGMDAAIRGIKVDHLRPDMIAMDDIDSETDSPGTVNKKISKLTNAILPTGSTDCAIAIMQNLIYEDGIVAQLVDNKLEMLLDRGKDVIVPAVIGLEVKKVPTEFGREVYRITAGQATWEGQSIDTCEKMINERGLRAFRRESQHDIYGASGFVFDEARPKIIEYREIDDMFPGKITKCRAWDIAATQSGGDFTVGALLGYHRESDSLIVYDVKRHQFSPDRAWNLIAETLERDVLGEIWEQDEYDFRGNLIERGKLQFHFAGLVITRLPQEPAAAGKFLSYQMKREWGDYDIKVHPIAGKKAKRATTWARYWNAGRVFLVKAPWNHAWKEEHRKFKEDESHDFDDQVDVGSDATNELVGVANVSISRSTSHMPSSSGIGESVIMTPSGLALPAPQRVGEEKIAALNCHRGVFIPPPAVQGDRRGF